MPLSVYTTERTELGNPDWACLKGHVDERNSRPPLVAEGRNYGVNQGGGVNFKLCSATHER